MSVEISDRPVSPATRRTARPSATAGRRSSVLRKPNTHVRKSWTDAAQDALITITVVTDVDGGVHIVFSGTTAYLGAEAVTEIQHWLGYCRYVKTRLDEGCSAYLPYESWES